MVGESAGILMAIGMAALDILPGVYAPTSLTNLHPPSKDLAPAMQWADIPRRGRSRAMRVYLVIIDETEEARAALRFAARRAADTGGAVHLLAVVPKQAFNAFGGVQATIEEEARDRAEVLANSAAGELVSEMGQMPQITVCVGDGKTVIQEFLKAHPEVAALVLGAAKGGNPGPLVSHFSAHAGSLPCPAFLIPGGLSEEEIDRLS
jgi:nucleotide-binding universal stress UspA family protein